MERYEILWTVTWEMGLGGCLENGMRGCEGRVEEDFEVRGSGF